MTYEVRLQPDAILAAARIYLYYEKERTGLGERFLKALNKCYGDLEKNPNFQVRKSQYRYILLHRFPYRVIYIVEGSLVHIYTIRHMSRRASKRFGP
ncbi:MAG: type II toxin-antitoxin system RelE/ParE family toxin [Bacteroidota bacterium]|nr:type II toxin-antitoxin system RelE/ParE family toxin [Bacteroidota bacterium]